MSDKPMSGKPMSGKPMSGKPMSGTQPPGNPVPGAAGELPASMRSVHTRPLFVMRLKVKPVLNIGPAPDAHRRVGIIEGGSFTGERLSGAVLEGGSDWQTIRRDGTVILDVRLILKTADGGLIGMTYQGVRCGPPDVMAKIDRGEDVEPGSDYFRIQALFQAAAPNCDWLNRVTAVGIGHRFPDGPLYSIFEVL